MFYALCLLAYARGRVQVVQSSELVELLHGTDPYKKAMRVHMKCTTESQSELFYVNRFYRNDSIQFKLKRSI